MEKSTRPAPSAADSFSRPSHPAPSASDSFSHPVGLKKSRSQHFLTDREVLKAEANALEAQGKDVLEIGAGDGRLSQLVYSHAPNSLTLVELDKQWAGKLRAKFNRKRGVKILNQDVLELPDSLPIDRVIGNIPYQITSPILLKLAKWKPERAVLCIQKEVAARMAAQAGSSEYGRLSVFAQLHFEIKPLIFVPRTSFHPVPKVDSTVLLLKPKAGSHALPPHLDLISAALFSHRLASVGNALLHSRRLWGWDKKKARQAAQTLKCPEKKVFQLDPSEVVDIAKALPALHARAIGRPTRPPKQV